MVDRPSAQDIEELIDRVRRDPSSNAFVDLGEAYLALGRPRDAIGVCGVGLNAAPNNNDGRIILARAFVALHQWREAQGELLRVVKTDRQSRRGFALLGEVLLRRNDFERAVPVLQQAQILDPTSPHILMLLKRARNGQPLDPAPPPPEPIAPKGETNFNMQAAPPAMQPMPMGGPMQPMPMGMPMAPMVAQPPPQAQPPRPKGPTVPPPPQQPPKERPRVIPSAKVVNAAAASLRQSAAVGETYLADLLGGGLLEVAGVRVPDMEFDLRPDRRWSRSTRRAFLFLFVVVLLGSASGGTWWWWSQKQKADQLASLEQLDLKNAEPDRLDDLIKKFVAMKDADEPFVNAYLGESAALDSLLYGAAPDQPKDSLIKIAQDAVTRAGDIPAGEPGVNELALAKVMIALATLPDQGKAAPGALGDAQKILDGFKDDDQWAKWLKGRAQLAGGERKAAKATFKTLADAGFVLAMIDEANLLAVEGNTTAANKLYDKALAKSAGHPLALVNKALSGAEAQLDPNNLISDYSVSLADKSDKKAPRRIAAYRALALALAQLSVDSFKDVDDQLTLALDPKPGKKLEDKELCTLGVAEPRFWGDVAWIAYWRGDIVNAKRARACAQYYKAKPEDDPVLTTVDAAIAFAEDRPDRAITIAHGDSARERMIRIDALLDQGKAQAALGEGDALVKQTTPTGEGAEATRDAQMLYAEAFLVTESDHEKASNKLEGVARGAQSKRSRDALGNAWLLVGNLNLAEQAYQNALKDLTPTEPNPVAYRSRVSLANVEMMLAAEDNPAKAADDIKDKLDKAGKLLDDAQTDLATARGKDATYPPLDAARAKLVLRRGDPDKAADQLAKLVKDAPADVQLAYAEALATKKTPDRDKATSILRDLKDKVQPALELGRVARLLDINLPGELGAPVPPDAPGPPGVVGAPPEHHHH